MWAVPKVAKGNSLNERQQPQWNLQTVNLTPTVIADVIDFYLYLQKNVYKDYMGQLSSWEILQIPMTQLETGHVRIDLF